VPSTRARTKPGAAQLLEHVQVLALALAHDGRQQHELAALGQIASTVSTIWRHGLRLQVAVVRRAVRLADAGEEQAQVVVDLGDRADGGARVVRGRLLLDRDGR
jgi:hypothetical protein